MRYLAFLSSALLFLAVAKLPIGYYTFLRIAVFIFSLLLIYKIGDLFKGPFSVGFLVIAIIFNPIFPIYLHSKSTWIIIDLLCGGFFLAYGIREIASNKSQTTNE
jgi:hypothetical protein